MSDRVDMDASDDAQGAGLVPRLRFPEFPDLWRHATLGEIVDFHKGKGVAKADLLDSGSLPAIRYGELYTKYGEVISSVSSYTNAASKPLFISESNDVIIPSSGETKHDIAAAACVLDSGVALGGDLIVMRGAEEGRFLSYYLNGQLRGSISQLAQGDAVVHLYASQLGPLMLWLPKRKEQIMIADCLSSLDDLIVAETRKLDALKTHKKGLMQQLFPREGETVPRLRFPEFRGMDSWNKKALSEICLSITNGKANAEDHEEDGIYPLFDRSEAAKRSTTFAFDGEAVILPGEGAHFQPRHYQGKFNLHQRAYALMRHRAIAKFVYYSLDFLKDKLAMQAVRSTVLSLRLPIIRRFELTIPSLQEQQRIADCLSSLDDLIVAETRKLDVLKTHKKGLMQQLFPLPEASIA